MTGGVPRKPWLWINLENDKTFSPHPLPSSQSGFSLLSLYAINQNIPKTAKGISFEYADNARPPFEGGIVTVVNTTSVLVGVCDAVSGAEVIVGGVVIVELETAWEELMVAVLLATGEGDVVEVDVVLGPACRNQ